MTKSHVFHFDQMTVQKHDNGGWGRPVMHGTLPTGEFVEVHETMLPPGQMPHPPHKHRNTEFVLMREGNVEYWGEDGKHEPMGPGRHRLQRVEPDARHEEYGQHERVVLHCLDQPRTDVAAT